jgi:hypothetical protein
MTKYQPLESYLAGKSVSELPMSFADIERLIAAPLPPVARKHRAWWSNNPSNSVITKAWLGAGYRTAKVDMGAERLVFRKADTGAYPDATAAEAAAPRSLGFLDRLRARLAGTVTIPDGVDITAPTGEVWDAER